MYKITFSQLTRFFYILGLMGILAMLPFSKIVVSIGQMVLAGTWIVERFDYKRWMTFLRSRPRFRFVVEVIPYSLFLTFRGIYKGLGVFVRNKPALIFFSILVLHLIGLFFTSDFNYALKDLRTKVPLFLFPLFIATSAPFEKKAFHRFMLFFVLALLVATLINSWKASHMQIVDIREIARSVSHIIFGLLLTLGIFSLGVFTFRGRVVPLWAKGICLLVLAWFLAYMVLTKSMTGLLVLLITLIILIPIWIFRMKNRWVKFGLIMAIVAVTAAAGFYLRSIVNDYYQVKPVDYRTLEQVTSRGNRYVHNVFNYQTENGNRLWLYVQWDELRESWNHRSRIRFDSLDLKRQPIAFTLVRFLTSRGYRKDADAVEKLTSEEVFAIEKGEANYIFMKEFRIRGWIYEFLLGYDKYRQTGNATGSSMMQRLEYWKASIGIIERNWLTGVGTGDMNIAFKQQYIRMHSKLDPDQRHRSHNQFLSIFVGFGVFGLAWFLFAIFYPPFILKRFDDYFFFVFLIIALLSMMTEDTIESQMGVTFVAFFYSFFLFGRKEKEPI